MEPTTIPPEEWETVVRDAEAFWEELAGISPRTKRVVDIFKQYNQLMHKAGVPYRYL